MIYKTAKTDVGNGKIVWEAWPEDLPGCIAQAPTEQEAIEKVKGYEENFRQFQQKLIEKHDVISD